MKSIVYFTYAKNLVFRFILSHLVESAWLLQKGEKGAWCSC